MSYMRHRDYILSIHIFIFSSETCRKRSSVLQCVHVDFFIVNHDLLPLRCTIIRYNSELHLSTIISYLNLSVITLRYRIFLSVTQHYNFTCQRNEFSACVFCLIDSSSRLQEMHRFHKTSNYYFYGKLRTIAICFPYDVLF